MASVLLLSVICLNTLWPNIWALDNGLARTPPMGWLTWERFRCNKDCVNDPDNCIGERLIKQMAKVMATEGYLEAGYQYIIIDDCWPARDRAADGQLVPEPSQFPNGIKSLADYVHGLGLKFGIYEDYGTHTCAGFPGSKYYMQMDAETFASWGVDYLKLDGCWSDPHEMDDAYPAMTMWLNRTGRPILFSCSWPAYQEGQFQPDYKSIAKHCNIWRNYGDIDDSWESVKSIIDFYGDDKTHFAEVAGPGNFNDPDMIIVGGYGLSYDQQRVQMGMWAIMASPLIISVDLRKIKPESKALLLHKEVIKINQDPLGIQGTRLVKSGNLQVWRKPISPVGCYAFAYLNTGEDGEPKKVSATLSYLGFNNGNKYNITDVFSGQSLGVFSIGDTFSAWVNPTGIFFGKAVPV